VGFSIIILLRALIKDQLNDTLKKAYLRYLQPRVDLHLLNKAKRLRPSVTAVVLDLVILLGLMCPEKICRAVIVSTSMLTKSDLRKLL
jgi:hypothetical protein